MVLLHNFGTPNVTVTAKVGGEDAPKRAYRGAILLDVLDGGNVPLEPDGGFSVELGRYGYRWFRVQQPGDRLAP